MGVCSCSGCWGASASSTRPNYFNGTVCATVVVRVSLSSAQHHHTIESAPSSHTLLAVASAAEAPSQLNINMHSRVCTHLLCLVSHPTSDYGSDRTRCPMERCDGLPGRQGATAYGTPCYGRGPLHSPGTELSDGIPCPNVYQSRGSRSPPTRQPKARRDLEAGLPGGVISGWPCHRASVAEAGPEPEQGVHGKAAKCNLRNGGFTGDGLCLAVSNTSSRMRAVFLPAASRLDFGVFFIIQYCRNIGITSLGV